MYKWLILSGMVLIGWVGLSTGQVAIENVALAQGWRNSTLPLTQTVYLPLLSYQGSNIPATPIAIDCNPSHGTGGLTSGIYSTTVAGLKAMVVVGPNYNPQTPTYLGFFLHGDDGGFDEMTNPDGVLTQFIQQHNWILVSPQSPNGWKWWTDAREANYVPQMRAVMVEMFAKYNVCRNILFGSGESGGSEFIVNYFFPETGADYPTHYVLECGGDVWLSDEEQRVYALGKQPHIVARSSFTFVYGTNDFLYDTILHAIRVYTAAGLKVKIDETVGMGHCETWYDEGHPDTDEKIRDHWDILARELKVY